MGTQTPPARIRPSMQSKTRASLGEKIATRSWPRNPAAHMALAMRWLACCASRYEYCAVRSRIAMPPRFFRRGSSRLHGICHFRKLAFLLLLRQWTDVVFKMLFGCRNHLHDLAVEQTTHGFYVRNLRVILEPHGMREAAPRQGE